MDTNQFYNTRSLPNTHQLKKQDFKTEKYDRFSILSKCLSDWNLLQNALKTTPYTSILLHYFLSLPMSFLSLYFSIFLSLSLFLYFLLSSPTKEPYLILKAVS